MKTKLFTLALLLMSAGAMAQTAFTQATLNEILAEYKANSKAFFTNRLSDDFRYANPKGAYQGRNDIVSQDAQKILKVEIADATIFQSGDLAVVSGIHRTERVWSDGNPVMGQILCTYTFQRRQNKWLFVASQQTAIQQDQPGSASADVSAIKAVLEGHTQACGDNDADKAVSYFANSPNTAILHQAPGSGYIRGYQSVADAYRKVLNNPESKKSTDKLTTGDHLFRIMGNAAFVTYIETQTAPDGTTSRRTHKANYLEKENGQWKMLGNFWMPEMKAK